ncbi:MAG: hypothetical protein EKK53_11205 [Burkholderiales bacterium]|nr:MAG: hypothetical protein EKK53_11205 [Burkholderiales bacterium]
MNYDTQHRNAAVLRVLKAASGPLTPTQIAASISEPWCCYGGTPNGATSAPISAVLKRIGAVKGPKFGTWLAPA